MAKSTVCIALRKRNSEEWDFKNSSLLCSFNNFIQKDRSGHSPALWSCSKQIALGSLMLSTGIMWFNLTPEVFSIAGAGSLAGFGTAQVGRYEKGTPRTGIPSCVYV